MFPTEYQGGSGTAFINIWNQQASIAREVWEADSEGGRFSHLVYCTNADELADDILAAIERAGRSLTQSGRLPCPPDLAAQAVWG